MKKQTLIIIAVFAVGIFCFGYNKAADARDNGAPTTIAVVSIPEVMEQCERAKTLQTSVLELRDQSLKQLEKEKAALQVIKADIEARKPGSEDYLKLRKEYMQKKASIEASKEFLQQELMTTNQRAMEKLYLEIVDVVKTIAKTKGYDLVLDRDKVEIPAVSATELTLSIQTHKVLYYADYLDITEEVVKAVDKK